MRSIVVWLACLRAALGQAQDIGPGTVPLGAAERQFAKRQNVPPNQDFVRRLFAQAAVIGDYVYFDGGEIGVRGGSSTVRKANATLAIDISKSWSTENVEIIQTEYEQSNGKQVLLQQAILVDESAGSFYAWGGRTTMGEAIRDPQLWRFQPDGSGQGEWTNDTPDDTGDTFFSLKRSRNNSPVSTPKQGFIFGGWSETRTTSEPDGAMPGFLTFDFETKEWTDHNTGPYSPTRTQIGGNAVFVPEFGPNGLIFVLGGAGEPDVRGYDSMDAYIDFQTLHFMDPVTKTWYTQETTGSVPSGRTNFCVGSVADGNGRFDIFIYGGRNIVRQTDYSDVYVLSLPGFRWTAVSGPPNVDIQRREHVCAVIGRRHLISWGGVKGENVWEVADPWPQGVGVFDMTALEWTHEYDADARPYEQHARIKDWYDDEGEDDIDWSSSEVRALFSSDSVEFPTSSPISSPTSSPESSPETSPESTSPAGVNDEDDGSSSSVPVGAIAGGVVGGVAVVAIIAGVFWFLRRRKRQSPPAPQPAKVHYNYGPPPAEVENNELKYPVQPAWQPSGTHSGDMPPELFTHDVRYEVDGTGIGPGHQLYNKK